MTYAMNPLHTSSPFSNARSDVRLESAGGMS